MLFNSAAFAIFLPVMLTVYWLLQGGSRRVALLIGSYFFYSWWDWRFISLLILSTVVDFCCARAIERRQAAGSRKLFLALSVCTNLSVLGIFKYFDFFRDSVAVALSSLGIVGDFPTLSVLLPMGISFYTFQTMSYTIDVYRGHKAETSLLDFAIFVACFPQLVAGPIMRAKDLLPQIQRQRRFDEIDISTGVFRILRGLFKKMIVADALALYVDLVFGSPGDYPGLSSWIAMYAYAFQIYMDFSGYTDVALGVGHLFGLRLTENFDRPYLATGPSDFWRRWHVTLSTWLRDYLYIPLGGSRGGARKTVRNLFITMALGGLWHGAAWTFVAWGLFHAALLTFERFSLRAAQPERSGSKLVSYQPVRVLLMFHLTCLGWLVFRSPDFSVLIQMLSNLVDFTSDRVYGLRCGAIVLACALAHALPWLRELSDRFARWPALGQGAMAAACVWVLLLMSPDAKPFIYFQF